VTLLYNSLQSVANQGLANSLFHLFIVIYIVVRSLVVGDLVEEQTPKSHPYYRFFKHINSIITNVQRQPNTREIREAEFPLFPKSSHSVDIFS
jgi:hypothetical protein